MNKWRGFTIVELLIVIVVIGILAAITMVAFNGIQNRSTVTSSVADLRSISKALELYKVDNSGYPSTSNNWQDSNSLPTSFVPGLQPDYIKQLPVAKVNGSGFNGAYLYRSDGTNYKLIAHSGKFTELCSNTVRGSMPSLVDPTRDCWAYGLWSQGGAGF